MRALSQTHMQSRGWAEPILWGVTQGFSIAQIAEGLELHQWEVVTALELHAPAWFGRKVRAAWLAENYLNLAGPDTWAMLNWLKSTHEAARLLQQMEAEQ